MIAEITRAARFQDERPRRSGRRPPAAPTWPRARRGAAAPVCRPHRSRRAGCDRGGEEVGQILRAPAQQMRGMRQPDALRGRQRRPVGLDAWLHSEEARGQLLVAALSNDVLKCILDSSNWASMRRGMACVVVVVAVVVVSGVCTIPTPRTKHRSRVLRVAFRLAGEFDGQNPYTAARWLPPPPWRPMADWAVFALAAELGEPLDGMPLVFGRLERTAAAAPGAHPVALLERPGPPRRPPAMPTRALPRTSTSSRSPAHRRECCAQRAQRPPTSTRPRTCSTI